MTDKPETVADVLARKYSDDDLHTVLQDWDHTDPDQAFAMTLAAEVLRLRRIERAMAASAVPVARVAEVHLTRYTIEWIGGPLPEGALLYGYPPSVCWQHRPGSPCPWPASCRSNGCSAVERELYPEDAVPPAVPVTESNCAERIALMLMDCADMLGMFPCAVIDSRAWEHLLVYAPKPAVPVESPPASAPDGFYLASFKHATRNGAVVWWQPDNAGYTPDLEQAGIYTEITPGYHDSEHTVPVPVRFLAGFRIRRTIDPGDLKNRAFWSAADLRAAIATTPEESP